MSRLWRAGLGLTVLVSGLMVAQMVSPSADAGSRDVPTSGEGESFAGPLRETKVCDALVVNMIDVGEETGDLDKMLMKIADNRVQGITVMAVEPTEAVFVNVIGDLNPEELEKVMDNFDVSVD